MEPEAEAESQLITLSVVRTSAVAAMLRHNFVSILYRF